MGKLRTYWDHLLLLLLLLLLSLLSFLVVSVIWDKEEQNKDQFLKVT